MKIKKIRVKNFRSIKDFVDVYLEDKITVFAGKNESGKTALLEAIEDFDADRKIRPEAVPIYSHQLTPQVSITFEAEAEEINTILDKLQIGSERQKEKVDLELIKTFPDTYSLSENSISFVNNKSNAKIESVHKSIRQKLSKLEKLLSKSKISEVAIPEIDLTKVDDAVQQAASLKSQVEANISRINDESEKNEAQAILSDTTDLLKEIKQNVTAMNGFIEELKVLIPNFIYFDSFNNSLPFQIPITNAKENKAVLNFAKIADIDLDYILDTNRSRQDKINYLNRKSATITGDFLDYWNQDKLELKVFLDGDNLMFGFVEEDKSEVFTYEQRSKGFQWFLSFYVQIKLFYEEDVQNFLLIDEPGLYLHAKAQRDVLSILEKRSEKMPVVFSTHSPYLLEPDKLYRLRLVMRTHEKGTVVESKVHKVSDKETLTPILTAIGLELTTGITNQDKLNNVIVEGPSDWYYFMAFRTILDINDVNFIYGGGSGNMPHVGTILQGWGCKVLYLYDNDQGKKDGKRNLTKRWLVEQADIKSISDEQNVKIEDLFEKGDFKQFVLRDTEKNYSLSNSEYLVKTKKQKALLAKLFWSDCEKVKSKLSDKTKKGFQKVFEVLKSEFDK